MMDIGRVCVKIAGKDAGRKCVVVEVLDEVFVLVSGPSMKRRRCNVSHLEPLQQRLEIPMGATDQEVSHALEEAGLIEKPAPTRPEASA